MALLTGSLAFDLLGITVAILAAVVAYYKYKFTFWEKAGLPTVLTPSIPFGNASGMFSGQLSIGQQYHEYYQFFKSKGLKHGGVYFVAGPSYVPVDPEIVKNIMQKDFANFVNHGNYIDERSDPLSGHLFNLEDAKWRQLRVKLTPTFTSGKMKMMFQTLVDCTAGLKDIMDRAAGDGNSVDIKDTLGRFSTDIIGSCAFGLECNTLKNPDSDFRKYGKRFFEQSFMDFAKLIMTFTFPHGLLKAFGLRLTPGEVEDFFMNTVTETVKYREANNIFRKDFMHLLLQLKNRGKLADDEKISDESEGIGERALTMNELVAQAFVFFVAGFETSSTTMTFVLYELATNSKVQTKLREEINSVLAKHNDTLTYEAMMEMTYMDKVINEALRKYPPVPILVRICNKDYVVPGTDVLIKKGTNVGISVLGLQHDEEYFPEPEKFDPERFSEENKAKRHPFTFLPFGEGPRLCIGLRFGLMQSKVGLTTLLKNYKIKLSPKTQVPLKFETRGIIMSTEGGIWIDVEKLS